MFDTYTPAQLFRLHHEFHFAHFQGSENTQPKLIQVEPIVCAHVAARSTAACYTTSAAPPKPKTGLGPALLGHGDSHTWTCVLCRRRSESRPAMH